MNKQLLNNAHSKPVFVGSFFQDTRPTKGRQWLVLLLLCFHVLCTCGASVLWELGEGGGLGWSCGFQIKRSGRGFLLTEFELNL